jgi:Copper transport outer membrane protein, MctB
VISFRNHVVTLVAVFLALAAGIVLGGGPLSEVGRSPLASATSPAEKETADVATFGDTFAAASAGRLYASGLEGHPVTVLTLPGSDEKTVAGLTAQVEKAGGSVAATYAAQDALVDPSEKSLVDTLGSQLMTQLDSSAIDNGAPTYVRMGQLLGAAISTTAPKAVAADENASAIRQAMAGAELTVNPKGSPQKSPLVLVVLGEDTDDDVIAGLLAGLSARAAGVVAVGDTESGVSGDLAGLRSSAVAGDVTTVDGTEHGLGQVTAALALIRSLETKGGAFGASGSDGAVPLG